MGRAFTHRRTLVSLPARSSVRSLRKGEKPRPAKRESAYFETDELVRIFAAVEPGLYRTLFEVALKSGARAGELFALTWGDVDLGEAVIRVRRSLTDGFLTLPKNHERRDVHVPPELVDLLGEHWGAIGRPGDDDRLVFPGPTKSGYLNPKVVLAELYRAMAAAGIPREGPTGELRTFHSFRHSYSRAALQSGRPITWLSRQLGHHSIIVTVTTYGHFETAARRREAELMEGVFGV